MGTGSNLQDEIKNYTQQATADLSIIKQRI